MLIKLTGTKEEKENAFYTMITNGQSNSGTNKEDFIINEELYKILKKKHKNIKVINRRLCLAELETKK